jgi:hypothetical protein
VPVSSGLHDEALMARRFIYLHGFASSPRSGKATVLAGHLRPLGLTLEAPDLNVPDFRTLTVTRMVDQTVSLVTKGPAGPVVFIGSSLGGVVALQAAARLAQEADHAIERLVLLAPALDFDRDGLRFLGRERLEAWRETGTINIFHYGEQRDMPLGYAFYADSQRFDTFNLRVDVPIVIFQGRRDEAVDYRMVERYAATRPNVQLRLLDDEHQLTASLPVIWQEMAKFLALAS